MRERKVAATRSARRFSRAAPKGWRSGLPFVVGALVIFLVVSPFVVDYHRLFEEYTSKYLPLDLDNFKLDQQAVSRYLTVTARGGDSQGGLRLEVTRAANYPTTLRDLRAEEERLLQEDRLADYVALEKIVVVGKLRVEYLDADQTVLETTDLDVRGLLSEPTIELSLPIRRVPGCSSARLGF